MPFNTQITGDSSRATQTSGGASIRACAVRPGDGEVLRHHLAEHDVQVDHDPERQREGHRVHERLGHVQRLERVLDQVRQGRLGYRSEPERADGDAELGSRQHRRDVLHRPERRARATRALEGHRLDLAAAGRHHGELGADEEGVGRQQQGGDHKRGSGAHDPCPGW
jgi:hypothetical protein